MLNKAMKERFIDETTGIEYVRKEDYYLPNLVMPSESTNYQIGKYGRMKLNYLKNNKKAEYSIMLIDGLLNKYLHEIDVKCNDRVKTIIAELAKLENITEELKATNQLKWVQAMNNIKNRAEEIIFNELIYV